MHADPEGHSSIPTIAQLRAVLAVLQVDTTGVAEQVRDDGMSSDPAVAQAVLIALLHRVVSNHLRLAAAFEPDDSGRRWAAVCEQLPLPGENPAAQASFDAYLLHRRITALAADATIEPVPELLKAAAYGADAAGALLMLSQRLRGDLSETLWQTALHDLCRAYHLVNDEHVGNVTTQPLA